MDTTGVSDSAAGIEAISGYRIHRLIERGGMGAVYLAEDENLQRRVAIKVIHPEFTDDPEYKKRFAREALTVAAFQHPNIVTVYASGRVNDKQYIVMEYVAGGTLDQRMSSERLTQAAAAAIAGQMADALAYAHERDVIHRDFKPRNVLLRQNGSPVLSDFGVAKSQVTKASETAVGMVLGNLRYMAPEQALGVAVTNRIDIYSFGLVLHEMLVGKLPEVHPVRTKKHERALVESAGKQFAPLIGRCLQAEPGARPSAVECRDWLASHASRPSRWGLRRASAAGLIATVIVALAVGWFALRGRMFGPGRPVSSAPPNRVALVVQRLPPTAKIFVDTRPLTGTSTDLEEGTHELVAVAPGYYGEIRHLTLTAGNPTESVTIALEAARLPSIEEEQRFAKLTEASALTTAGLSSVTERTLGTVLQAQLLRQTGDTVRLEVLSHSVETLRRFGDARAAVASLLIASQQSGHISRSQVTQSLIAASEGGDAMASLFLAVAYRESINASDSAVSAADPRYRSYCQHVALAVAQGWAEVAGEYWRRDHCSN